MTSDDRIRFAGHSLGGALAQVEAVRTGRPADTFNAPGMRNIVHSLYPDKTNTNFEGITNHVRDGDEVGNYGHHVGRKIVYPNEPSGVCQSGGGRVAIGNCDQATHSIHLFVKDLFTPSSRAYQVMERKDNPGYLDRKRALQREVHEKPSLVSAGKKEGVRGAIGEVGARIEEERRRQAEQDRRREEQERAAREARERGGAADLLDSARREKKRAEREEREAEREERKLDREIRRALGLEPPPSLVPPPAGVLPSPAVPPPVVQPDSGSLGSGGVGGSSGGSGTFGGSLGSGGAGGRPDGAGTYGEGRSKTRELGSGPSTPTTPPSKGGGGGGMMNFSK